MVELIIYILKLIFVWVLCTYFTFKIGKYWGSSNTAQYMVELGFRTVISPIWGSILIAGIYLFVFVMMIIGANNNAPIEPTWLSKFLKIPNF